jgi:hypothetical protein
LRWADRRVETAPKASVQTIHFTGFAMCPLTSHFLEMTGLQESASDDEAEQLELPFLAAACHAAAA